MPNITHTQEIVFNNCVFFNAVSESNTYFMVREDKEDIKIKVIGDVVFSTKPISEIDKEIVKKLHNQCNIY